MIGLGIGKGQYVQAQTPINPGTDRNNLPPSQVPIPETSPLPKIPSLRDLGIPNLPDSTTPDVPGTIKVKQFRIIGSTVFSQTYFDKLTEDYLNREISIADLFELRSKITQEYLKKGYVTSGAIVTPQRISKETRIVEIQVIEGRVEEIQIRGTSRLSQDYIRSRIAPYTGKPLNRELLLSGLQLLKLNPLINNVKATLAGGIQPGSSILEVEIGESPIWNSKISADNHRSPSAGTDRWQTQIKNINLFGLGDNASLIYINSQGSNSVDLNYDIPLNPQNTHLSISYGTSASNIIEAPFNTLDIQSRSSYYEIGFQHPIVQTPTKEFTVGLTASHRQSKAKLLDNIPFPSAGADLNGETRLSALRFVQSYTQRSENEVFAARSQFNLGIGALGSTINNQGPDSRFIAWRGQGQYVKVTAPDSMLLVRGDLQVANRAMLPFEQFGLGGVDSVRGYRQDALLADNGAFASAEYRFPISKFGRDNILLMTPFTDFGTVWNNSSESLPKKTLFSVGLGLRYQPSDRLTTKVEWGIPLISLQGSKRTWQENGIYLSVFYNLF
jgi:hemolysin activation/secretion protein